MKVYLHVGLHKTATKYFQHKIFKHLNKSDLLYNPEPLTQYMMDYIKADKFDKTYALSCFNEEFDKLEKEHGKEKILLISKEALSGNLFSGYNEWNETVSYMKTLFPMAKLFIFFRYQVDWLISCYRESIHEHHYQSIEDFLNYNKKITEFEKQDKNQKFANLSIYNLNYAQMLKIVYDNFNSSDVNIFFYEDFQLNKQKIIDKIFTIMELKKYIGYKALDQGDTQPNRGYSALAIAISVWKYNLLRFFRLNFLFHRPIYFVGEQSIPAGNEELTCLNKNKYWSDFLLRDNEEIRSVNYPHLTLLEKIRREFTWRYFIKNRFDKLIYIDWDLLKRHRRELDLFYKNQNKELSKILDTKGNNVPKKYL